LEVIGFGVGWHGEGERCRLGEVKCDPAVVAGQRPGARPDNFSGRRQLVEHGRRVVGDTLWKNK
jgi:hypothetical protein